MPEGEVNYFILRNQKEPRMRRHNLKAAADDDSLPVMVPRNDKAAVPILLECVRRGLGLRKNGDSMKAPGICSTDDPLPRMLIGGSVAPSPGDGPQGRRGN